MIAHQLDHLEGVLITSGAAGCAYAFQQQEGRVPAFPADVVDTTGAGDSFLAGFIHQLCRLGLTGLADPQIARDMVIYASAVGALATVRTGAIASQPTAAEVAAFCF
ncbi:PfkB family carbohydrate kinase [Neosynechococcus sphagnicola]|uniref:PfkB family carbohydrate kinase n=1 Tax=Neosynechococcus sphagnicola TaxID=1501145 RepID=UPI000AAED6C8|nr:PfkB family carbohydrate kinase [Neosynechococcus sphagnicola]